MTEVSPSCTDNGHITLQLYTIHGQYLALIILNLKLVQISSRSILGFVCSEVVCVCQTLL